MTVKSEDKEIVEIAITDKKTKQVILVDEPEVNIYNRRRLNLQLIALATIIVIMIVTPLQLLDSRTILDFTAIGFIAASLIPALIAIFGFMGGRKISLFISTLTYGVWIVVLSSFYIETILMIGILIIYFEVTRTIIYIEPILEGIKSISEGGAYYHASVILNRYFRFLLRFGGILFASSLAFGIIGYYAVEALQGDIIFSIFMIVSLIVLLILSRRTLTPDMKLVLLEEKRRRRELEFASSQSRYS